MKIASKQLPKGVIEFTIEVPVEEQEPHLLAAAKRLAAHAAISGFRKGNAPFEVVKARLVEAKIMGEATEDMVRSGYAQALAEERPQDEG